MFKVFLRKFHNSESWFQVGRILYQWLTWRQPGWVTTELTGAAGSASACPSWSSDRRTRMQRKGHRPWMTGSCRRQNTDTKYWTRSFSLQVCTHSPEEHLQSKWNWCFSSTCTIYNRRGLTEVPLWHTDHCQVCVIRSFLLGTASPDNNLWSCFTYTCSSGWSDTLKCLIKL